VTLLHAVQKQQTTKLSLPMVVPKALVSDFDQVLYEFAIHLRNIQPFKPPSVSLAFSFFIFQLLAVQLIIHNSTRLFTCSLQLLLAVLLKLET
jgi:hypothetical protein